MVRPQPAGHSASGAAISTHATLVKALLTSEGLPFPNQFALLFTEISYDLLAVLLRQVRILKTLTQLPPVFPDVLHVLTELGSALRDNGWQGTRRTIVAEPVPKLVSEGFGVGDCVRVVLTPGLDGGPDFLVGRIFAKGIYGGPATFSQSLALLLEVLALGDDVLRHIEDRIVRSVFVDQVAQFLRERLYFGELLTVRFAPCFEGFTLFRDGGVFAEGFNGFPARIAQGIPHGFDFRAQFENFLGDLDQELRRLETGSRADGTGSVMRRALLCKCSSRDDSERAEGDDDSFHDRIFVNVFLLWLVEISYLLQSGCQNREEFYY